MRAARALTAAVVAGVLSAPASAGGQDGTTRVGAEVPVTAEQMSRPQAHNSPALAVDPTEPRFVALAARTDSPDFGCTLHLSGDGGATWLPASPVPALPAGADKCYAPEVAFDAGGRLHYLFVGLHGLGNQPMGAFLTTSDDRGRRFSTPRRLLGPHVYMVRMALDRATGRLHLTWVQAGEDPTGGGFAPADNPLLAAFSDDGGRSVSRPVRVSDPGRTRVVGPALAVGAGDRVHVAYYDLGDDARDYQGLEGPVWDGTWALVSATSDDRGRSFRAGVVVDDAIVPPERLMVVFTAPGPALAGDAAGRVYVAWTDARRGDWDVLVRRSDDGASSWGPTLRLHDDAAGSGGHQYLPRLAVADGGRVDAVYYDRGRDPDNLRNDVAYALTTGAAGFGRAVRVTSEPSDTRVGPTYPALASAAGLVEFGSRIGLVARPDGALLAWTDTRTAQPAYDQQNIVAAAVTVAPGAAAAASPSPGMPLVGAVVGAVALLALLTARRARAARAGQEPTRAAANHPAEANSRGEGRRDGTTAGVGHAAAGGVER